MAQPAEDIVRVVITYTHDQMAGETAANVMHFERTDALQLPLTAGEVDELDAIIVGIGNGTWGDIFRRGASNVSDMRDRTYYDLSVDPPVTIFSRTTPLAGINTGIDLPPQNAVCLSLRTGTGGRSGRGRVFLPYVDSTVLSGDTGRLSVVQAQGYALDASEFVTAVQGLTLWENWGVLSRVTGGVERPVPLFSPVTDVQVGVAVDTIRGRRDKISESYQT